MLDELLLEGIGPSPEAVKRWEEKRAAASRSCSPPHPPAPLTVEEELALERQKVEALEAKLEASRLETDAWIAAASSLVNMLFLSPSQNANHAASVSAGLESAIGKLGFVKELRYCDCSFPASDASKPKIVLRRWTSLEDSEWDLAWTPAWTCEACIDGQRGITFSTLMKVSGIAMAGRLAISFAADFSAVRVRFTETPTVHLDVACHVTLGQMPLPIQAELGRLIRDEATKWLNTTMVAPNEMTLTLASKKELSDTDMAKAQKAALIGAQRAQMARSGSWGPSPRKSAR